MQIVKWTGSGDGTFTSPFVLNVNAGFNAQQPFNVNMVSNYIASQNELTYIRFNDSSIVYLLASIISNRDSLMYFEQKNAIKTTMFLTDHVDYIDGPYVATVYMGIHYIVKQQVFDPLRKQSDGTYQGLWVSGNTYEVNDMVLYEGKLYVCIQSNYDTIFTHSKWINLSGGQIVQMNRDPLPSDYNYSIGTTWINTENLSHFVLVNHDNNIAKWNVGSVRPDDETLAFNHDSQLEIKNKTIEGGEWE